MTFFKAPCKVVFASSLFALQPVTHSATKTSCLVLNADPLGSTAGHLPINLGSSSAAGSVMICVSPFCYVWAESTDGEQGASSAHLPVIPPAGWYLSVPLALVFSRKLRMVMGNTSNIYRASRSLLQELALTSTACEAPRHIEIRDEIFQSHRRDLDARHPLK